MRVVGSGVSCDPGGHGGGGGASPPAPGIRAVGAFGRERGRRASRVPASLSWSLANRRPGGMDGCRTVVVEHSGVERDEVASTMDGCSVE